MRTAGYACLAFGEVPTRRNIQRRIAQLNNGKTFGSDEVHDFLRTAPWQLGPAAVHDRSVSGPALGPDFERETADSGPAREAKSAVSRSLRARSIDNSISNRDSVPNGTSSPSTRTRAKREKPESDPLPELPAAVEKDYRRLVALDADRRTDGKIAESVVEADLLVLRRAYEKHGIKALVNGIDVALRKGKGVRFAAACTRNYDARTEDDSLQVPSFRDRPRAVGPFDGPIYTPTAAERDYGIDR
jgi:hypothetical protein